MLEFIFALFCLGVFCLAIAALWFFWFCK